MNEENIANLKSRLEELSTHISEAVDLSLAIVQKQPKDLAVIAHIWEEFLGGFYQHVRKRSHETGLNLMGWLAFRRIARR